MRAGMQRKGNCSSAFFICARMADRLCVRLQSGKEGFDSLSWLILFSKSPDLWFYLT